MAVARLARVIAVAPAVLTVTAAQLNLPSATFWTAHRETLYIAVGLFMVSAVHEIASFVSYYSQLEKLRSFERNLRGVLSAGIAGVADATNVEWKKIGVTAYVVRNRFWLTRLALVEDFRLGQSPVVDMPPVRPGKGVAGKAFVEHKFVCEDWEAFFKQAYGEGKNDWEKTRSPDETYGLTWGELMRTESSKWIAAFPMFSVDGKAIGVVTVDAPADLSGNEVTRAVRDIAMCMSAAGKPPSSWWSFVAIKKT